jgi:hypothetical protein
VFVDNPTSTDRTVTMDTTNPGAHTILYTFTDPNGLTPSFTPQCRVPSCTLKHRCGIIRFPHHITLIDDDSSTSTQ